MAHNIIQWNCRGLKPNYNELLLLISEFSPEVICLQETFLTKDDKTSLKHYTLHNFINSDTDRASGGTTVAIANRVPHTEIPLNTNLQAVAIRATLHRPITICSLYIPPRSDPKIDDLNDLLEQLPQPCLLLGDFNGHNPMWGSSTTNTKGNILEKFINTQNICLLNDKSNTYLHPGTGSFSAIDLSLAHPSLFLDYSWSVLKDQHGSDHFPILLSSTSEYSSEPRQYYKFNKADWDKFKLQCNEELNNSDPYFKECPDPIFRFSSILSIIADDCIPKTSINVKTKRNRPWFDDESKKAVRKRNASLRKFEIRPTNENLQNYKIMRAKARRTIRQSKRKSWQTYVSKINSNTPSKKVWDMIRKISGKSKSSVIKHLKTQQNSSATTAEEIANTLAESFASKSSSDNYSEQFKNIKSKKEKQRLNFNSKNDEDYNKPFSITELKDSLSNSKNSAAGPDDIHYQFLKNLPPDSLQLLLNIFNDIWSSGKVPDSWKEATVIPVPKPGKDDTDPVNYRPISLTSCVCKTLERMINARLVWYLESQNIITNFQSGFRTNRSTNDHLVRLETFIREAFVQKQHLVSVFFDLEKAYDTTWKYGILKDLKDIGLNGRLPTFISSFLSDRNFQVRVGSTLSETQQQEEGVPQGSILSVTLFSIKINNIVKALNPGVDCSLYVDDFVICYRSKSMRTIERQLQTNLDKIHSWATENGFKFSQSKTQCVHFCRLRKIHEDPTLYLNGSKIPVVSEAKFLGVIFDRKLSFIPHIKYLKSKCLKTLNLLKVLSNTNWGGDRSSLLRLYRSLVRSKLDYGCIVYGSARKSYLQMLDTIHHQGLRLALGAFRTSPVESLYVEANEPSLYVRREKLLLQYATRVATNTNNPAHDVMFDPNLKELFDTKPKEIKPIGIRLQSPLEQTNINPEYVAPIVTPETPPWTMNTPKVIMDMSSFKKSECDSETYKAHFGEIRDRYNDFYAIYTDGSKDGDNVGCAAVSKYHNSKQRLPDNASIFSAEVKAIDLALTFASTYTEDKYIIFSDSLSVLTSLKNRKTKNALVQEILLKLDDICKSKEIVFCWIPSHIGIRGNEKADCAAKQSLNLSHSNVKLPFSDFKPSINKYVKAKWQTSWDGAIFNKLHSIKPILGDFNHGYRSSRREETVLTRCRIGHTRITHSYLLQREEQPECIPCNEPFTVKHFLLDCVDLALIRERYFNVGSLYDLFRTVSPDAILGFLKESGVYNKI